MQADFANIYENLPMPVIVCSTTTDMPIAYMNTAAKHAFTQLHPAGDRHGDAQQGTLENTLRFRTAAAFENFRRTLEETGVVRDLDASVLSSRGDAVAARIYANAASFSGQDQYVIYVGEPANPPLHTRTGDVFRTVVDNLNELVYISDPETYELKFVSRSLARAMGRTVKDMVGKPCWRVLHNNQAGPCPFCPLPRLRDMKPGDENYVWELRNSVSGKWYMIKDSIIDWIDGERAHLGTMADITYRKQYEEQLKRFAATDAMTDVYNRKWGYGKMEELFNKPVESRNDQTLCFVDIDDLKKVNDKLGHAAGDDMIVNAIRTIFACIRKNDFITRWGGDEFILLLRCGIEDARGVLAKINFGIEHFNSTSGKPYKLAISAGLVGFAEPYESLDALIAEADARMYANKLEKRDPERRDPV